MIVGGRPHKPNALGIYDGQDPKGKYAKKCIAFADEYGYPRRDVCGYWAQIALAVEHQGRSRTIAEDLAWHHVQAAMRDLRMQEPN